MIRQVGHLFLVLLHLALANIYAASAEKFPDAPYLIYFFLQKIANTKETNLWPCESDKYNKGSDGPTGKFATYLGSSVPIICWKVKAVPWAFTAGARSKNSATNHSTFQKKSELFSIGGGHVVPVVNNTTCFSIYKWLLFLLLFSSYFPLFSHSFLK